MTTHRGDPGPNVGGIAYTIDQYTAFVGRRLGFIVAGTIAVAVAVGVISVFLPKTYVTSAVIDAGSVAITRGNSIDRLRAHVNAGAYVDVILPADRDKMTQVWVEFNSPNVVIHVEARDGGAAARAGDGIAAYILQQLPFLEALPNDGIDTASPEAWLDTARKVAEMGEKRKALRASRDVLVERMGKALDAGQSRDESVTLLASELARMNQALDSIDRDFEHVTAQSFNTVASDMRAGTERRPARLVTKPEAPRIPTYPRPLVNAAVAAAFGAVASLFVALLREEYIDA